ncbi:MAG: sulfatase-like hydrolase/transferase [Planctomycetaceae bacterium]|nr:sulfatase-like hydrolase/transferase [Planctomycetaceae bacterium]
MSRNAFSALLLFAAWLGAFSSPSTSAADSLAGRKPNIVFLITDDQGYGDISAHGNPILKTPNLDRLHTESVRFTDFHVSPTCAPTRSSLMTGRHEFKSGVTHTILERERMALSATTLPQVLKSVGYTTGIFGKWHLGDESEYRPDRRGFDETFIHGGGGIGQTYPGSCGDAPGNKYFDPAILHNGKFEKTQGYCTDVFFAQAEQWIERQTKVKQAAGPQPFFCYIATNAPHAPLDVPADYEARYSDKVENADTAKFFGMVANIDDNLGRLLTKLHDLGIERDTLVIFMNDNGGTAGCKVFNAGMRAQKGSAYRGGTRGASFWRWPGTLSPADCDRLAAHIDVLPTLAQIAGAKLSAELQEKLDGRSLLSLLENPQSDWSERTLFTHVGRWPKGADANLWKFANCSVRSGKWNLVSATKGLGKMTIAPNQLRLFEPRYTKPAAGERRELAAQMDDQGRLKVGGATVLVDQLATRLAKEGDPRQLALWLEIDAQSPMPRVQAVIEQCRTAKLGSWRLTMKPQTAKGGEKPLAAQWELYDLEADPGEATNVAADHPDVLKKLTSAYDLWWAEVVPATLENEKAVGPTINPFHEIYYAQFGAPQAQASRRKQPVVLAQAAADAKKPAPARRPRKPSPSLQPIQDVPGLPRVLLIGDSISMGYTLEVRDLLKGKANVHRIPTNGGPTIRGLESLKDWLGAGKWDVIHFNWGLHDLKFMPEGGRQVELADYEKNLRELVKQLKATGATLIWCSTTPVPEGGLEPPRKNADVEAYNAAAKKIMNEEGVAIDDLYAFALPKLKEIQIPVNVHFHEKGSAVLAEKVAAEIEKQLPKK